MTEQSERSSPIAYRLSPSHLVLRSRTHSAAEILGAVRAAPTQAWSKCDIHSDGVPRRATTLIYESIGGDVGSGGELDDVVTGALATFGQIIARAETLVPGISVMLAMSLTYATSVTISLQPATVRRLVMGRGVHLDPDLYCDEIERALDLRWDESDCDDEPDQGRGVTSFVIDGALPAMVMRTLDHDPLVRVQTSPGRVAVELVVEGTWPIHAGLLLRRLEAAGLDAPLAGGRSMLVAVVEGGYGRPVTPLSVPILRKLSHQGSGWRMTCTPALPEVEKPAGSDP